MGAEKRPARTSEDSPRLRFVIEPWERRSGRRGQARTSPRLRFVIEPWERRSGRRGQARTSPRLRFVIEPWERRSGRRGQARTSPRLRFVIEPWERRSGRRDQARAGWTAANPWMPRAIIGGDFQDMVLSEVPAAGGRNLWNRGRFPEGFRHNMDHSAFGLHPPGDAQKPSCLGQGG